MAYGGHSFGKKTFHKPTYCHHCSDLLWGLIGQGYICEGSSANFDDESREKLFDSIFFDTNFKSGKSLRSFHCTLISIDFNPPWNTFIDCIS